MSGHSEKGLRDNPGVVFRFLICVVEAIFLSKAGEAGEAMSGSRMVLLEISPDIDNEMRRIYCDLITLNQIRVLPTAASGQEPHLKGPLLAQDADDDPATDFDD